MVKFEETFDNIGLQSNVLKICIKTQMSGERSQDLLSIIWFHHDVVLPRLIMSR